MKDTFLFDSFDIEQAKKLASQFVIDYYSEGLDLFNYDEANRLASQSAYEFIVEDILLVLSVAFLDKRNLPTLKFSDKKTIVLSKYIKKWTDAHLKGYGNRPSVRSGNKSSTYPDALVKQILQLRVPTIKNELAVKIEAGHSLMMTIENMLGDLLEEYLSGKLKENGWICCWGSTIDAVDFCKDDGSLLQIKNSDNSENSSSSRVRAGTKIEKWYRRVSSKEDAYCWESLNTMVGRDDLSEQDFRAFVNKIIKENPECIFIEENHPLK